MKTINIILIIIILLLIHKKYFQCNCGGGCKCGPICLCASDKPKEVTSDKPKEIALDKPKKNTVVEKPDKPTGVIIDQYENSLYLEGFKEMPIVNTFNASEYDV